MLNKFLHPQGQRAPFQTLLAVIVIALVQTACTSQPAVEHSGAHSSASQQQAAAPEAKATPRIPAYHASAEAAKPFPKLLDPKQFSMPVVAKVYRLAHEIPEVLAQQPCYCNCDDGFGHGSLLDCYADDHGAG